MKYKTPAVVLLLALPLAANSITATAQSNDEKTDTSRFQMNEKFCEAGETQSSKYINSADSFILSCECNCTAQENRLWIVLRKTKATYQIDASKAVSTKEIENLDSIPDVFGLVQFCEKKPAANSTITILTKRPSANSSSLYCYSAQPFLEQDNKKCETAECKKISEALTENSRSPHAGSLCKEHESTILGFKLINKEKYVSICEGEKDKYLVYRYGTPEEIELQYPEKLDYSSWSLFDFHGYSRGGGAENDAMGNYFISFKNHGVGYTVSQGWRLTEDDYSLNISIDIGEKRVTLQGDRKTQVGSLVRLEGKSGLKGQLQKLSATRLLD